MKSEKFATAIVLFSMMFSAQVANSQRAIARDYAEQGDGLWNLFHAKNPKDHEWHYRGLAESLRELQDTFAYKEFEQLINPKSAVRPKKLFLLSL